MTNWYCCFLYILQYDPDNESLRKLKWKEGANCANSSSTSIDEINME